MMSYEARAQLNGNGRVRFRSLRGPDGSLYEVETVVRADKVDRLALKALERLKHGRRPVATAGNGSLIVKILRKIEP